MKIGIKETFKLMTIYVKNDYELDPDCWPVSQLLGSVNLIPEFFDSDSPTSDPAYWYDWRELIKEELEKNKSIIDEINGLTLEQGLVAMYHFFRYRYWIKDNNMLLKDAYIDLFKEYNANKYYLELSQLWQDWLAAVAEGKKFDKVFKVDPEVIEHLYKRLYSDKYSSESKVITLFNFMSIAEEDLTNAEVDYIYDLREIKDSKLFLEAMNSKFSEKINNIMKKHVPNSS